MILVTGATGHVGRAVVCRLASLGHDVVAMVRDVQAASRRLPSGIALRVADLGVGVVLTILGLVPSPPCAPQSPKVATVRSPRTSLPYGPRTREFSRFPSSSNVRESGRLHSRLAVP
jgi:NmrA-like family